MRPQIRKAFAWRSNRKKGGGKKPGGDAREFEESIGGRPRTRG